MKDEVDPSFLLRTVVLKQEEIEEKELNDHDDNTFEDHFANETDDDVSKIDDDDFFKLQPDTEMTETITKPHKKRKIPYQNSEKFRCWCGVQMSGKKRLRDHQIARHEEVPESEKPRCEICGKTFKIEAYLATHMKSMHGNQKPEMMKVPCSVCGKLLVKAALKSHENRHELSKDSRNARSFVCDLCGHGTSSKSYIHQHLERIHLKLKK